MYLTEELKHVRDSAAVPVSQFEFTDGLSLKYGQVTCYWPISTHHRRVKVHATCVKLASNLTELRLSATAQIFVHTSNLQPFIKVPISRLFANIL